MNINDIEKLKIQGNAHSDMHIFNSCHGIIMNEGLQMSDRIRAVIMIDKTMGITNDLVTEKDVLEYVKND